MPIEEFIALCEVSIINLEGQTGRVLTMVLSLNRGLSIREY